MEEEFFYIMVQIGLSVNTGLSNHNVLTLGQQMVQLIFLQVRNGGVFESTTSGSNWYCVNNSLTDVYALATIGTKIFAGLQIQDCFYQQITA